LASSKAKLCFCRRQNFAFVIGKIKAHIVRAKIRLRQNQSPHHPGKDLPTTKSKPASSGQRFAYGKIKARMTSKIMAKPWHAGKARITRAKFCLRQNQIPDDAQAKLGSWQSEDDVVALRPSWQSHDVRALPGPFVKYN
jgi:hypothetical protein